MAAVLTVSAKLNPFPFAAISIAAYIGNVETVYDDTTEPVLDLQGSKITAEVDIVLALAKAGGLADDSANVSFYP